MYSIITTIITTIHLHRVCNVFPLALFSFTSQPQCSKPIMNQKVDGKRLAPRGMYAGKSPNGEGRQKSVIQVRLAERAAMVQIADMLIDRAIEGDLRATEILLDRALGKAIQHVETSSESTIKHEYALSDGTQAMLVAMRQAMIAHRPAQVVEPAKETVGIVIDQADDTV
jgi:hypothetical protein